MKLFISYSRDDKAWVSLLWQALRDENHDAWMDRFIVPASDWWTSILENIEGRECFIFIMTPKSLESIYCQAELAYAVAMKLPILPVMLKPCADKYPKSLADGRVQFLTVADDMSMERVLLQIEKGLGQIRIEQYQGKHQRESVDRPAEPKASRAPEEALQIAEEALNNRQYDSAIKLLSEIAVSKNKVMANVARRLLERAQGEKQCGEEYASLKALVERDAGSVLAQMAWEEYQAGPCSGLDWDGLVAKVEAAKRTSPPIRKVVPPKIEVVPPPKVVPLTSYDRLTQLMPAPFGLCDIPAGKVTLLNDWDDDKNVYLKKGKPQTFDVPAFQMAKYPVTNAQFRWFVEVAKGYEQERWWTAAGLGQKTSEKWTQPRYWKDEKWSKADHPVVGVSWYESAAFCAALSEVTGLKISLPSEQQWQRAAQAKKDGGDSGWNYVWGNDWKQGVCNNRVKPEDSNDTTAVTAFENKGNVSPCGVVDMIGNVWEWCMTSYESGSQEVNGTDVRVLRGGSWFSLRTVSFRAAYRNWFNPHGRNGLRGFRWCVVGGY